MYHVMGDLVPQDSSQSVLAIADWKKTTEDKDLAPVYGLQQGLSNEPGIREMVKLEILASNVDLPWYNKSIHLSLVIYNMHLPFLPIQPTTRYQSLKHLTDQSRFWMPIWQYAPSILSHNLLILLPSHLLLVRCRYPIEPPPARYRYGFYVVGHEGCCPDSAGAGAVAE